VRRMCGIVGYAGPQAASPQAPSSRPLDVVLQGLARLEYRGYDSAGIAVVDEQVRVTKRSGKLKNLREALEATDTAARHTAGARQAAGAGQVADVATKQALGTTHGEWPSATPAGRPTAPPPTPMPIPTGVAATESWPWSTTGSSRTSPSCAPTWRPTDSSSCPRPTPRWPPTCWPARSSRPVT